MWLVHCSSCNETIDANAVFIRKHARDTPTWGNSNRQTTTETTEQNFLRQGQETINCSSEYGATIGALPTIDNDLTAKKTTTFYCK